MRQQSIFENSFQPTYLADVLRPQKNKMRNEISKHLAYRSLLNWVWPVKMSKMQQMPCL
jgi:hypothetical protein